MALLPFQAGRSGLASLFSLAVARDVFGQDFDGDRAFQACVGGVVDRSHAARPDRGSNDIRAETRARTDHRRETLLPIWGSKNPELLSETGVIIAAGRI